MNKLFTLCKVTLSDVFLSGSYSSKKKKTRISGGLTVTLVVMLFVAGMFFLNSYSMGSELMDKNTYHYLISIGMAYSALMTLALSIFRVPTFLYAFKDHDQLMSLPVSANQVLMSKLLPLYIYNLIYSAAFSIGYFLSCGILSQMGAGYYICAVFAMLFVPFLPLVIGSLLGLLLGWISKRSGNNTVIKIASSILLMLMIMAISFTLSFSQSMDGAQLSAVYGIVDKINFPVIFIKRALLQGDALCMILFCIAELLIFALFCILFARSFKRINSGIRESARKREKSFTVSDIDKIKTGTAFHAAYTRELYGFVNNTNYFLNTYMGYIMLILATIALFFADISGFFTHIGLSPLVMLVFAFGFFGMLSPITTPSVSLDAYNLWIYRSSPISARTVLNAKLAMALTVSLPVMVICPIAAGFALKLTAVEILCLTAYCVGITLLSQTSGLATGLALPKLDWTNEITVIKQSGAVCLSVFGGMGISIIIGVGVVLLSIFGANTNLITFIISIVMLAAAALIYSILMHKGARKFDSLEI